MVYTRHATRPARHGAVRCGAVTSLDVAQLTVHVVERDINTRMRTKRMCFLYWLIDLTALSRTCMVSVTAGNAGLDAIRCRLPTHHGDICMLYNCLEWYKWVLTNLYHDRQLYNTLIPPSHESPAVGLRISLLSGSVELTLRYTTPDIHCRHRRHECDGGISSKQFNSIQ